MNNSLKIILSIPVILIILYFIPILGIIMILARNIILNKKWQEISIILIIISALIYIPYLINFFNKDIVKNIIENEIYTKMLSYSKFIFITAVVLCIVYAVMNKIASSLGSKLSNYINKYKEKQEIISRENDLKIKEKQLKAKNNTVIYCSNCGADNIVGDKIGVCAYCRTKLVNKKYK